MDERLKQMIEQRRETAKELHEGAEPVIRPGPFDGTLTVRKFVVTLYEENTEYMAALEMLAEIHRWFHVEPKEADD
jgi:hypothetical protein